MDNLVRSLVRVQGVLQQAGVDSAVIGAMALAVWGEPRFTKDVDLKVLLDRNEAARLLEILPPNYQSIGDQPLDMLERAGMVFVIDQDHVRIDLLLADTSFDYDAIHRAVDVALLPGQHARVCTAEDLLVYKMISTREKDHVDALSVIKRQGKKLDRAYVVRWLREFEKALDDSSLVDEFERKLQKVL